MKLRNKMLLGSVLLAVVPVLLTAGLITGIANYIGSESVQKQARDQLVSIRDAKKEQIESYFGILKRQVQSYSNDLMIINAMSELRLGFTDYLEQTKPKGKSIDKTVKEYRSKLLDFYDDDFSLEFDTRSVQKAPDMTDAVQQLDDNAVALQYYYIALNDNPPGYKDEMVAAEDSSEYTAVHEKYHPRLRDLLVKFGFYDVYLVDSDSGDIVYSVSKKVDLGTSLIDGPFSDTAIGRAFRAANNATDPDFVALEDFAPYVPLYNDYAGFIASPIFDGGKKLGVLVFQMPVDRINGIMTNEGSWEVAGLGETGETYLVAGNYRVLNDRRDLLRDSEAYLEDLKKAGTDADTLKAIDKKRTSIGLHKVTSLTARAAIDGVYGVEEIEDYRGKSVLSAYGPLDIEGLSWGILAEIETDEVFALVQTLTAGILKGAIPAAVGVLLLGLLVGWFFVGNVSRPIGQLVDTVAAIGRGEVNTRAKIDTGDELETFANAFNDLLDERLSQVEKAENENDQLNNSVIELLKATAELSKRDLTVRAPVTQDVTGPVADAINLMASETGRVLTDVRRVAEEVEGASTRVNQQAGSVAEVAAAEREEVGRAVEELTSASQTMTRIAETARVCNETAERAIRTTQTALETVTTTVDGMNNIREIISETEKRIKRLGQRSQEINVTVDIINNIAERTHVLALNASMQAAAAGDAGRGFAVVAEEVQRLADSSRNATSQISTLVQNIQVETADTMATMNKTISQVVAESELAERAGVQMKETQATTSELVDAVKQIAHDSAEQARVSNELRERGNRIHHSTVETNRELEAQAVQTNNLVRFARRLLESVRLFKLPEPETNAELTQESERRIA